MTVLLFFNAAKAFNAIYVASGRGTVKLSADALDKNSDYRGIYFTSRGGTLDLNGFSQSFKKIAATDVGTIPTNTSDKTATLSLQNPSRYVYHGNITGNTNIEHSGTQKSADSSLIIDGNIDTHNDISVYRIPSFGYRVMPQHMQYSARGLGTAMSRSSL
ncbi:S6 family peptidase [Escherichia coli]